MTVYHELGHVFYYLSYKDQPYLFQSGAHDGFHEAIGDTVNLSMTPAYLHQIGLLGAVKRSREATINQQMKLALDKIAFLPFGKLIDEWRWKVFSGEVKPENYNAAWWQLREQYQGVARAGRAHRRGFRSGREVSHPGEHALHALLPLVHPAVPVPQGAVRGGRLQGPAERMLGLRQCRSRQAFPRNARARPEPAMAGHTGEADRHAPDGCRSDHRVLRAAARVAGRTEQGTAVRLVMTADAMTHRHADHIRRHHVMNTQHHHAPPRSSPRARSSCRSSSR